MSILFRKRPRPYSDDREDELPRLSARDEDDDDFPTLENEDDDIPVLTPGAHHKLTRQPVPSVQPIRQTPPVSAVRNPEPAAPYNTSEPPQPTQYAAPQPEPDPAAQHTTAQAEPEPEPVPPGASHVRPGGLFASEPGPEAAIQPARRAHEAPAHATEPPVQAPRPPVQQPQQRQTMEPDWMHQNSDNSAPAPATTSTHGHSPAPSSQELSRIIDRIVNFELEQAHERIRLRLMNELGDILKD